MGSTLHRFAKDILFLILVSQLSLPVGIVRANDDDVPTPPPANQPIGLATRPPPSQTMSYANNLPAEVREILVQLTQCTNTPICAPGAALTVYRDANPCLLPPDKLRILSDYMQSAQREARLHARNHIAEYRVWRIGGATGLVGLIAAASGNYVFQGSDRLLAAGASMLMILISILLASGTETSMETQLRSTAMMRALIDSGYTPEQVNALIEEQALRNRGWFWRGVGRAVRAARNAPSGAARGVTRFARNTYETRIASRRTQPTQLNVNTPTSVTSSGTAVQAPPATSANAPVPEAAGSTRVRIANPATETATNPSSPPPAGEVQFRIGPDGNLCVTESSAEEVVSAATQTAAAQAGRGNGSQRSAMVPAATTVHSPPSIAAARPIRRRPRVVRDDRPPHEGAYPDAVNFSREALSGTSAVVPVGAGSASSAAEALVPVGH